MPSLALLKMLLQPCSKEDTKTPRRHQIHAKCLKATSNLFSKLATFCDLQFLNSTADDKNDSVNQRMEGNDLGMRSPQVGTVHSLKN